MTVQNLAQTAQDAPLSNLSDARGCIRKWWIYKIVSPSGRTYVGITTNITNRIRQYKNKCHSQHLVNRSMVKYGWENHEFSILEEFESTSDFAYGKEMFWIRGYMSNRSRYPQINGMNLTDGGEGSLGAKHSDERKRQVSIQMKGNKFNVGRKQSQAHRDKIRKGNLGKKVSDRTKIIEAHILTRGKPIIQLDSTGGIIQEFRYIKEAAEKLDITPDTLRHILVGKTKRPNHANRWYTLKFKQK